MKYVTAIVLAAGRGLRFESRTPKPLLKINSHSVIIYCLNTLSRHPYVKDIILVVNAKNLKEIIAKIGQYRIPKISGVVLGGRARQDSVRQGLKVMDRRTDLILIHDGVRPFIDPDTISSLIKEAERYGAAISGVPVKATIKKIKNVFVEKTLDRDNLWEIQTPQVFKKELILKAYDRFGNQPVTDDASLVEKLGAKVKIVKGSYFNIKITTPEDLILAEAIACYRLHAPSRRLRDKV